MFRVTFFVGVGRVCSVEDVEQSLRDLGLVALTRALFDLSGWLENGLHMSIQI